MRQPNGKIQKAALWRLGVSWSARETIVPQLANL
jgi:hypothetical protein